MKKNKSILIGDDVEKCYICGVYGHTEEHHIFGGPVRKTSDKYGLVVHLCRSCHHNIHNGDQNTMNYLHRRGQMIYEEKIGTRQEFIDEFIRSYL